MRGAKMKKILILTFLMLLLIGIVSADGQVDLPIAGETLSDMYTFNASVDIASDNLTFAMKCDNANDTLVTLGTNETEKSLVFSISYNTSAFQDDTGCAVYIYDNSTTDYTSTTVYNGTIGSLIIDNTEPTTPSAILPVDDTFDEDGDVTITGTINSKDAVSCSIVWKQGSPTGRTSETGTYSALANTCSYSLSAGVDGDYEWVIRASDGTDTADSVQNTLHITSPSVGDGGAGASTTSRLGFLQGTTSGISESVTGFTDNVLDSPLTSGGLVIGGLFIGSVVPGVGNVVGAIAGLIISGFV